MLKTILTATAAAALVTAPAVALDHHKEDKMAKSEKGEYGKDKSIAAIAMKTDALSTLVAAVQAAELVEVLKGEGPYTVFAPTNDAFAEIQGTVDTLLQPENKETLQRVLKAHVVSGALMSGDIVAAVEDAGGTLDVETVSGDTLTVSLEDGSLAITDESGNTASVAMADVKADNGVVHVVDTVLVPQV